MTVAMVQDMDLAAPELPGGGDIVRDAATLATGERVHTRLASGSFDSQVLDGD